MMLGAPSARRRKVLHLITRLVTGGSQDNTLTTCELHDKSRYEVHIASYPAGEQLERAQRACEGRFHPLLHLQNPISPLADLRALIELVRLLRRERFDIVHGHSTKAGVLGRAASLLTGTLFVFTYHGFAFHEFMSARKKAFYVGIEKMVRRGARHYITLSEADRRTAADLGMIGLDNSTAVYTGLDFGKIDRQASPLPPDPLAAQGIPANGRRIVLVGRLDPQKAPLVMVEAFKRVVARFPDAQLVFVGDGELRGDTERAVREAGLDGRVHLLGHRRDVIPILLHCDVFAFSSLWEAMGRSMLEALLVERPVVAPAIYGIPEVVEDGVTGRLYEVGKADQLADRIAWYFDHPEQAQAIGKAGQAKVRSMFDARLMVERIEQIYAKVLAENAR